MGNTIEIGLAQKGSALPRTLRPRSLRRPSPHNDTKKQLIWAYNPSVQKLLDVISSILADEYIQIAKQNPEIFKNGGQK